MACYVTYIAGIKFRPGAADRLAYLPMDAQLDLYPEPSNRFDPNAVQVFDQDFHLGYVPKDLAKEVGQLIAEGRYQRTEYKGASRIHIHYVAEGEKAA